MIITKSFVNLDKALQFLEWEIYPGEPSDFKECGIRRVNKRFQVYIVYED